MADAVRFDRSLYRTDAIDAAVAAYSGLATFDVREEESSVAVAVEGIDPRVADRLLDAFCNHVLFETVRLSRRGDPKTEC